ncbi:MAG: DUF805 domain-containing protein [Flavobacteriaceae bacterium]|nr:DUF805 domain-containing protein [Flavobacteriaceae bacterium]
MEWFLKVVKDNYANFKGRAGKKEFWMFILVYFILSIIAGAIGNFINMPSISSLLGLALFVPSLAVGARRLHDTGKSGWLQLLHLIPILGTIVLIVFWIQDGNTGDNKYGSTPELESVDQNI